MKNMNLNAALPRQLTMIVAAAALGLATVPAGAVPVTYTGSGTTSPTNGVPVKASATFDIAGNTLTITLTNTSGSHAGQDVPGSTLTGLFFSLKGNPALTPVSALGRRRD